MLDKECFINALPENAPFGRILAELITYAYYLENVDYKVQMLTHLGEYDKGKAMALANWDEYENCNAYITHDLGRFSCKNLGNLITKVRLDAPRDEV